MRTCVIFNRKARGGKARRFRQQLRAIGEYCTLKYTASAGDARRLAANAIQEGFEIVVAAGGDGNAGQRGELPVPMALGAPRGDEAPILRAGAVGLHDGHGRNVHADSLVVPSLPA